MDIREPAFHVPQSKATASGGDNLLSKNVLSRSRRPGAYHWMRIGSVGSVLLFFEALINICSGREKRTRIPQ